MLNILCAIFMWIFGAWLCLLAYFGPYKEYLDDKAKMKVTELSLSENVTVTYNGKTKTWTGEEWKKMVLGE